MVIPSKYFKSYHMCISQAIYTYKSTSFTIFLTCLENIFFSCAGRVSFEYLPLETFAFIINDVFEKNNRDKGV